MCSNLGLLLNYLLIVCTVVFYLIKILFALLGLKHGKSLYWWLQVFEVSNPGFKSRYKCFFDIIVSSGVPQGCVLGPFLRGKVLDDLTWSKNFLRILKPPSTTFSRTVGEVLLMASPSVHDLFLSSCRKKLLVTSRARYWFKFQKSIWFQFSKSQNRLSETDSIQFNLIQFYTDMDKGYLNYVSLCLYIYIYNV